MFPVHQFTIGFAVKHFYTAGLQEEVLPPLHFYTACLQKEVLPPLCFIKLMWPSCQINVSPLSTHMGHQFTGRKGLIAKILILVKQTDIAN